jgi:hypothetical protein
MVQPSGRRIRAMFRSALVSLLLCAVASPVRAQFMLEDFAATTCGAGESLFRSGLEAAESGGAIPSGGGGGDVGVFDLAVAVPDTGRLQTVRVLVPDGQDASLAAPLVVVLHGAAGSPANAAAAAAAMRNLWATVSTRESAIVLAPIASGASGGWVPAWDTPALACAIAQLERRYNIDRSRRFLWGFSAGAHYGHALALGNAERFGAYAINAGALWALACGQPGTASDCAVTLPQVTRRIPVRLRVGSTDPLASYVQGDAVRFDQAGWANAVSSGLVSGGHTVGNADIEAAWGWFAAHRLPP